MNAREKRVEKAQMRVLFNVPFFAPAVARLPVSFSDDVETAHTDGQSIVIGTKFMDGLTDAQLVTLICHEACHPLLGHLWRAPGGADWDTWNQAADHAVNLMLKEFSAQVMAKRLADPFPFPPPPDAYCANPAFSGMPEEQIYGILASQKSPQGSGGKKGQGQGKSPAAGQGKGQGSPSPHSMPSFGQMQKPKQGQASQSSNKKLQGDWNNTLIQSVEASKGRGDVPGCLQRFVDEMLSPSVPWWEIVRNWLREQAEDDWNWMVPNLTYDESGFILPSLRSERMGPIIFATDTSGSVDQALLAQFRTEKQNALDELKPSKLVDFCCDASITLEKEYRAGDVIAREAPGGGGTDFRPVFKRIEELGETPKCVVYLTDLQGAFPDKEPDYPTLWVVWGGCDKAPWGEVVKA